MSDYSETKTLYLFYFSAISYKLSCYGHNSFFRYCDGTKVTKLMKWTILKEFRAQSKIWLNNNILQFVSLFIYLILVVDLRVARDNFLELSHKYYYYCCCCCCCCCCFTITYVTYVKFLYDKIIQIMLCNKIILYSL